MAETRLQKQLRGTTRAAVEGALEEYELGINNETEKEELITKIPGPAFLHIPTEEKLGVFSAGISGSRGIGVEDDNFISITGNTDLLTTLKSIDGLINGLIGNPDAILKDGTVPMLGDWEVQSNVTIIDDKSLTFGSSSDSSIIYDAINDSLIIESIGDSSLGTIELKTTSEAIIMNPGVGPSTVEFFAGETVFKVGLLLDGSTPIQGTLGGALSFNASGGKFTGGLDVTGEFSIEDGITTPATVAGKAFIFIDSGDGDPKIKFGDGTVKTIDTTP